MCFSIILCVYRVLERTIWLVVYLKLFFCFCQLLLPSFYRLFTVIAFFHIYSIATCKNRLICCCVLSLPISEVTLFFLFVRLPTCRDKTSDSTALKALPAGGDAHDKSVCTTCAPGHGVAYLNRPISAGIAVLECY